MDPIWRIEGPLARVDHAGLRAVVDRTHPEIGLRVEQVDGAAVKDTTLFRIDFSRLFGAASHANGELIARGADLIATFSETPEHPFHAQAYWRLLDCADEERPTGGAPGQLPLAGIELILSVQTSLLDSDPTLIVESILPASHVERLAAHGEASLAAVDFFEELTLQSRVNASSGTGCFRFTIPGGLNYIEMVHPADFEVAELEQIASGVGITHQLFARFLEKGVILRSRLRGLFFAAADGETVSRRYDDFARSAPPLTV